MKTQLCKLSFILIILYSQFGFASATPGTCLVDCNKSFKRTYLNKSNFKKVYTYKKNTYSNKKSDKKADDVSISFNDFSDHLAAGKNRIAVFVDGSFTMDIGKINSGEMETWVLQDLKDLNSQTIVFNQMESDGVEIEEAFGVGTHVLYAEELKTYELYDLDDEELFFIGFTREENGEVEEYDYDQAKSPVPLEYGKQHISVVNFMDRDKPGTFVMYTDIYNVVGQGTLKTYDDGDADALKMIYTEETRTYEDYVLIDTEERHEVVFYSKKGHYITAEIFDPEEEGAVNLKNLVYQKLEQKTASTKEHDSATTKMFPNPINIGQVLKFESLVSLKDNTIDVYTINGQKVSTLILQEGNNNQYEITVPKNLSSGLYFYNVKDIKGNIITNGKIQLK